MVATPTQSLTADLKKTAFFVPRQVKEAENTTDMNPDSGDRHSTPLSGAHVIPLREDPVISDPQHHNLEQVLIPGSRGLISGLLGLNVVLLGVALITGQLFKSEGQQNQEARVFLLLLMGVSVAWMLWYLLWARKQPDTSPHQDHHAGGVAATSKRRGLFWKVGACFLL